MTSAPSPTVERLLAHRAGVTRVAWAVGAAPHDVEDAAQDAWVAFLERPPPDDANPAGWRATVARHAWLRRRRSARRAARREAAVARREAQPATADVVARAEAARRVAAAVLALDEPYRTALLLRYYDGLPPRAVAARTGAPVATVRTRLARGIARVRLALTTPGGGRASYLAAVAPVLPAPPASVPVDVPIDVPVDVPLGRPVPFGGSLVRLSSLVSNAAVTATLTGLALLLSAWSAWRVAGLASEMDDLTRRPAALVAQAPLAEGSIASRPPPPLAPSPPLAAADAVRPPVADPATDARLRAMQEELAATRAALDELLAERREATIAEAETAAVSTGRNVIIANAQVQTSARIDVDRDGTGEYGGFLELAGAVAGRMSAPLNPPVMSRAFRTLSAAGEVERNGYLYRLYLPDARGVGVGEPSTGFDARSVDPDLAETTWCLYAWPVAYGRTGRRTFFVNQGGDTLATDAPAYDGPGKGPAPDAAFRPAGRGTITGPVAIGTDGNDGRPWR